MHTIYQLTQLINSNKIPRFCLHLLHFAGIVWMMKREGREIILSVGLGLLL